MNTSIITQAFNNGKVISIEVSPDFVHLDATKLDGVNTLDFVFYDGGDDIGKMKMVFNKYLNYKNDKSVFVFNNIYHTSVMDEAWKYIKNHPETIVSIDLFYMGIVLFRKEMSKQQIKYRY